MKHPVLRLALIAIAVSLGVPHLWAGTDQDASSLTPVTAPETSSIPISQEFSAEGSYSGGALTKQGSAKLGNIDNINGDVSYVISPQVKDGFLLRFGFEAESNSFGLPNGSPLPNTLASTNLIIGADIAVTDKILFRVEAHPGIYSDFVDVTGSDFDMPVQFGGTYLYSKDLQIILGGEVDLKSDIPFIIVPGVRWQFADKWVLSAIPPRPQLQYEFNNALTLYVGAEIIDGTYQLNNEFGSSHQSVTIPGEGGNLNGKIVDFNEDRIGIGATWKFTPNLSLDVSTGYIAYRQYDIHDNKFGFDRSSTEFHNNIGDGAPYGEMGIKGSF
jgi:hypothetical protein